MLLSNISFSQSVPSYVPTNGLVGWWGFNGNAQDGSGNGNHGTVNGATLTNDRFGNINSAFNFNGVNSFIELASQSLMAEISNADKFSISIWALDNISNGPITNCMFGTWSQPNGGIYLNDYLGDGFAVAILPNGTVFNYNTAINNGLAHHFVVTYDGTQITNQNKLKVYKDGILLNLQYPYAVPNTLGPGSNSVLLGARWGNPNVLQTEFWNGILDDIGIWNRALTPQEITNLYNSQVSQPCTTSVTTNHNINGCGFAILTNGDTVTQSGNYLDTLSSSGGCDSILNQTVTIQPTSFCNPVPSYVPTNGLVGWWGFNGNAQDGSGNGNHGTVNGATLTTDRFGNQNGAYSFDGVDDYILANQYPLSFPLSYLFWIKADSLIDLSNVGTQSNSGATIISQGGSNNPCNYCDFASGFKLGNYGAGELNCSSYQWLETEYGNGCNFNYVSSCNPSAQINFGWQHITVVMRQNILLRYFNGTIVDSISHNISTLSHSGFPLSFGARYVANMPGTTLGEWKGKIDDIGIWNRALNQQEITNLYNSQLPTQTYLCLPTITTSSPSSVGLDSVVSGGDISNDGGSSIVLRGVCYSTSPNPNMGNQRTEDGSGTGSFNTVLRGLNPSTIYYARSYAKNSNGVVVYGNEVSFTTSSITIGSNYAGGIVFYVDGTGQHGLVCAPSDQGSYVWGCDQQFIGGISSLIGFGLSNTNRINLLCSQNQIASRICADLNLNNYSDWYLPSFNELMEIFWTLQGTNGFSNNFYWSSTEDGQGYAKCMYFSHGFAGSTSNAKFVSQRVRAIRSF